MPLSKQHALWTWEFCLLDLIFLSVKNCEPLLACPAVSGAFKWKNVLYAEGMLGIPGTLGLWQGLYRTGCYGTHGRNVILNVGNLSSFR